MGKGVEAVPAVIRAHSALAYTAEAHTACCQMYNNIIYATAAVGQLCADSLDVLLISGENIKRQRFILPLEPIYGIVETVKCQNRHN